MFDFVQIFVMATLFFLAVSFWGAILILLVVEMHDVVNEKFLNKKEDE